MLELLKVFSFALLILTSLLLLVGVVHQAKELYLGIGPMVQLIPFVLPNMLVFTAPASLLYAVCVVYSRLANDNEIIASKSLGVSPIVLLRPSFVLAFTLSLVMVWLNDVAFSWGYAGIKRIAIQSVEEIAYNRLRAEHFYQNDRFSIHVSHVDSRKLMNPVIQLWHDKSAPPLQITAQEAELESDLANNNLCLILTDCDYQSGNVKGHWPGVTRQDIPLTVVAAGGDGPVSPAHLPLWQISGAIKEQKQQIDISRTRMTSETTFHLATGNLRDLKNVDRKSEEGDVLKGQARLHRLRTEPWRRYANGFSCLCVTAFGVCFAAWWRNLDYMQTFGICFTLFLVVYFGPMILLVDLAKSGSLPPYVVWIPNLLFLVAGGMQLRYVLRY